MIRTLLLAAALVGVPVLCACQAGSGGSRAARDPVAEAAATTPTPMRFRRLRSMLDDALRISRQGTAAAVRARGPAISREGLALIKATLPHDVARTDVPRYLEGRARFGEALKAWVTTVESGSDIQLILDLNALDDATRGWIDAYLGREPETSI